MSFSMKTNRFPHIARLLFAALLLSGAAAQAQAPPTGGPQPMPAASTTNTPIDGGVSILLASGAAYGLKRLRRRKATA